MAKLFIIAGHGAGDPGAIGNGYKEAERVRALAQRVKDFGGSNVKLGDFDRNYYKDHGITNLKISKDYKILELHMDSASSSSAKGAHVIIKAGFNADAYDKALAKMISGFFPGRSKTIVGRSDLANPNRAANKGYNYRLMECGFISNANDVKIFNSRMDDIAKGILKSFGIGVGNSDPEPSKPTTNPTPDNSTDFLVKVTAKTLNIRSGPGVSYAITGVISDKGVYTIVDTSGNWGKLKSGKGWISLNYTERMNGTTASKKSIDVIAKEVIAGKWGNGADRKKALEKAGYDYETVQKRVNQLL